MWHVPPADQIDVASVMAHFKGGGHEKAAAAMIPASLKQDTASIEKLLEDIQKDLVSVIETTIRPALTVSQVMSRRPMMLTPKTSIEEAATLMQRYGYEGFPVVEGSRVAGLLTRRIVDRAIAHKLQLPVAEIMEIGSVSVLPGDSLGPFQKVMAETGWGQVPVYDPDKDKLVGIVTRTDLLRVLSSGSKPVSKRKNLGKKLDSYLPKVTVSLLKLDRGSGSRPGLPCLPGGWDRP